MKQNTVKKQHGDLFISKGIVISRILSFVYLTISAILTFWSAREFSSAEPNLAPFVALFFFTLSIINIIGFFTFKKAFLLLAGFGMAITLMSIILVIQNTWFTLGINYFVSTILRSQLLNFTLGSLALLTLAFSLLFSLFMIIRILRFELDNKK